MRGAARDALSCNGLKDLIVAHGRLVIEAMRLDRWRRSSCKGELGRRPPSKLRVSSVVVVPANIGRQCEPGQVT